MIMFVAVFWKFFCLLSFPDSSVTLKKGDPLFELKDGASFTQMFTANEDNLNKLEFLLRTPGPKNKSSVRMEIADATCEKTLRQGTLRKSFVSSGNLHEFKFDIIPDSQGKTYCLKAEFSRKKPDPKKIRFFTMKSDDPKFAIKNEDGNNENDGLSLSMRTVHKSDSLTQNLGELNERISQYKPFFLKHYFLYAIVFLFLAASVSLVVILIVI